jgi:hypothetical protein
MVSRIRMKLDLFVQSFLLFTLALVFSSESLRNSIITLIVLVLLQILSTAQLWLKHAYRPAGVYLGLFLATCALLPIGLYFFNPIAWSVLLALSLIYYAHTIRIALVVLRRPRSFWDIS